jgi:hypothetical protein
MRKKVGIDLGKLEASAARGEGVLGAALALGLSSGTLYNRLRDDEGAKAAWERGLAALKVARRRKEQGGRGPGGEAEEEGGGGPARAGREGGARQRGHRRGAPLKASDQGLHGTVLRRDRAGHLPVGVCQERDLSPREPGGRRDVLFNGGGGGGRRVLAATTAPGRAAPARFSPARDSSRVRGRRGRE